MAYLARRFSGEIPDGFVVFQEFIAADGVLPFGRVLALEGIFAEDQEVLVHVPQGGVACRLPRAPSRGRGSAGGLVPDDLAAHQEAETDGLLGDESVQRDIRFAAQVCHVDAHPPAGDQDALGFFPDTLEEGQVLVQ